MKLDESMGRAEKLADDLSMLVARGRWRLATTQSALRAPGLAAAGWCRGSEWPSSGAILPAAKPDCRAAWLLAAAISWPTARGCLAAVAAALSFVRRESPGVALLLASAPSAGRRNLLPAAAGNALREIAGGRACLSGVVASASGIRRADWLSAGAAARRRPVSWGLSAL